MITERCFFIPSWERDRYAWAVFVAWATGKQWLYAKPRFFFYG